MASHPANSIHVTGFGVFRRFTESNPSWQAVLQLPDHIMHNDQSISIVKHEIPVTYVAVDQKIKEIWASKPKLVIHCGARTKVDKIYLEKNAFNGNFREADYAGQMPESCSVALPNGGTECEILSTSLDLLSIKNETEKIAPVKCSNHPGNYLCGYIYLKSLDMNRKRSLFVHVPAPRDDLSVKQMSDAILSIIIKCVEQLDAK